MEKFNEICSLKELINYIMEFTAELIASHLGGEIIGRGDVTVSSFAKIEDATAGTITFLANPKYTHYIYNTAASIVLVRRDFEPEHPVAATLIKVDDPYGALAELLSLVGQYIKPKHTGVEDGCHIASTATIGEGCYVGAFAYIADGARIGRNVKIYPQAYIGDGVEIGDDTVVYPVAKIYYGCRIGRRCVIHAGAVIGADGFGFAPDKDGVYHKIEQIGIVVLEDDVEVGANTTIDRSTMGFTLISHGVKLDNLIQIAHNVTVGHDTVMASQVGIAGSTHVGANCMFGGQVGLAGHITIADGVQIGAQAGVPSSIKNAGSYLGTPAVPAMDFMRQSAAVKRLPQVLRTVDALEKEQKKNKQ